METQIEFNSRTKTTNNLMFSSTICSFMFFSFCPFFLSALPFSEKKKRKKERDVHISKLKFLYGYQENERQHPTIEFNDGIKVTAIM